MKLANFTAAPNDSITTAVRRVDRQAEKVEHEVDLEAPHRPREEVHEDGAHQAAPMRAVEARQRAVEPLQPLLVARVRSHAEPREEPAPASGRPEELDHDEAGHREGLEPEENGHAGEHGPRHRHPVRAQDEPQHEEEALAGDDGGLVHDDRGQPLGHRHPVTEEERLDRLAAHEAVGVVAFTASPASRALQILAKGGT